jgi:hypothetical protein
MKKSKKKCAFHPIYFQMPKIRRGSGENRGAFRIFGFPAVFGGMSEIGFIFMAMGHGVI